MTAPETKTVTFDCTWTNSQQVEVPVDWDGSDVMQFADQVDASGVDLYDMEVARTWDPSE